MVLFHTQRTHYSAKEAGKFTLTIGELIEALSQFDEDEKIVFCNDNGYTYGKIDENLLVDVDDDEDDED